MGVASNKTIEDTRNLKILENLLNLKCSELNIPQSISEVLFDTVTHLPTLRLLLSEIREILNERNQVAILTLNISPYTQLEQLYGWEAFDGIIRGVADCMKEIKQDCLRKKDLIAELSVSGNSFVMVLSPPRYKRLLTYEDLSKLRNRIYGRLKGFLKHRVKNEELAENFGFFIGCSLMEHDPSVRLERLVYRSLDEAFSDAFMEREREIKRRSARLNEILDNRLIRTVYQPIVDLKGRRVIAYEAFSRGPKGEFEYPDYLFKVAYESNLLWKLERICRDRALKGLKELKPDQLLFLNIDPDTIFDPELSQPNELQKFADRIVFEITERAAINDFGLFRRALEIIKALGFKFSIDDVGSAYSGLRLIAEILPDYIKLDMSLARGVQNSEIKKGLIRTISDFTQNMKIPLIVEGIESPEELNTIQQLGIELAQGYLFATPDALIHHEISVEW